MSASVISFALLSICGTGESTCGMQGLLSIMFHDSRVDRLVESKWTSPPHNKAVRVC